MKLHRHATLACMKACKVRQCLHVELVEQCRLNLKAECNCCDTICRMKILCYMLGAGPDRVYASGSYRKSRGVRM